MKAEPAIQRKLLELASVDAELTRVEHRQRTMPERGEVETAEKEIRSRRDAYVAAQTANSDLDREIAHQEKEIDAVRARIDRDIALQNSASTTAKQLTDLEHELETLHRRQSILEDDQLELMERKEATELDAQRAGAEVDEAQRTLDRATQRRDEILDELSVTKTRREADRAALTPTFPAPLLNLYERVRQQRGIGAAPLPGRRCGSCQLELDQATMSEIKAAAPDVVVQCDNCSAILVRAESSR